MNIVFTCPSVWPYNYTECQTGHNPVIIELHNSIVELHNSFEEPQLNQIMELQNLNYGTI